MKKPMKHKDGKSTVPSKEFRDGWDRIFKKKKCKNDKQKSGKLKSKDEKL